MSRPRLFMHGLVLAALLLGALAPPPAAAQPAQFASPAFATLWTRYDGPVAARQTNRSWTWGPNTFFSGNEPYQEAPGGQRTVQYFDKARMEINDPATGVVTNGLLVRELVSGRLATGNVAFEQRHPAVEPVAGDPAADNDSAPTYGDFDAVASVDADRRAPDRNGQPVDGGIDRHGHTNVLSAEQRAALGATGVVYAYYEPTLGHNMPNVFLDFVNQRGLVAVGGQAQADQVVFQPWQSVMGLPITEPYWTQARVGGEHRNLLVQLFERRALTFTPSNPDGFKVEMGNVGQHYYAWRSQPTPPGPPQPPTPAQGAPFFVDGPRRTELTSTSARITWETNEPTTGRVEYDVEEWRDPYREAAGTDTLRTRHDVTIGGLQPNRTYYWRVASRNAGGREVPDEIHSFRTDGGGGNPQVVVESPRAGEGVRSPLRVRGREDGTGFDGTLLIRLRDARTGHIYASATVQRELGQSSPYEGTLHFGQPPRNEPGVLEVLSHPRNANEPAAVLASEHLTVEGSGSGPTPPQPPSGANTVARPAHDQRVSQPVRVVGAVDNTVAGEQLVVRVREHVGGTILGEQAVTATRAGNIANFSVVVRYREPARTIHGLIEVVALRTTDGRTNVVKVSVPVMILVRS